MRRSFPSYIILLLLIIQIISAVPAGLSLVIDPSGELLGLEADMLKYSPFADYLIPGLFLLIVLGILPAIIFYGLVKKSIFRWAEKLNLYKDYHWSLTFTYYFGLVLILWINFQLLFLREYSFLQVVISILGAALVFLANLPATKKDYKMKSLFE